MIRNTARLASRFVGSAPAMPTSGCIGALPTASASSTARNRRAYGSINYRGSSQWLGISHLPGTLDGGKKTDRNSSSTHALSDSRRRKQTFKEAIHLDKYNKNYDELFLKLGRLVKETLTAKQFLQIATYSTFDMIVLQSFVHHCQNPRYGYGFTSPIQMAEGRGDVQLLEEVAGVLAAEEKRRGTCNHGGEDAGRQVLYDGPTWYQQLKMQNQQLVPTFFAGCG